MPPEGHGGVFAQRGHSANYYSVYPGNTPENQPPTEACLIHSKQHLGCRIQDPGTRGKHQTKRKIPGVPAGAVGCRIQDPGIRGYRWWKTADFSHSAHTARAQRAHGAQCAPHERDMGETIRGPSAAHAMEIPFTAWKHMHLTIEQLGRSAQSPPIQGGFHIVLPLRIGSSREANATNPSTWRWGSLIHLRDCVGQFHRFSFLLLAWHIHDWLWNVSGVGFGSTHLRCTGPSQAPHGPGHVQIFAKLTYPMSHVVLVMGHPLKCSPSPSSH